MNWLNPILTFLATILEKTIAPLIAYFTGKEVEKRKHAESIIEDAKKVNDARSDNDKRKRVHEKYK